MSKQTYERKVIKGFTDKNTKKPYPKGAVYKTDDKDRVNELVKKKHISGNPVKAKVETATPKANTETADALKHVGGGYYELPNGEKVQGKEKAEEVLKNGGE